MSVVSSVATVESRSATMSNLPPRPCHTACPRLYMKSATLLEFAKVPGFKVMFDATVNTSKSKKTTNVPSSPPRPEVFLAFFVSSLRFAVTSHPQ